QRGSAPGPQEDEVHDIADMSTEIMPSEIEDLGDQGAIDMPEIRGARRPGISQREQGGWRPRSGQIVPPPPQRGSPRAPRPGLDWDEDDEPLPQIPARGSSGKLRPSATPGGARQRPSQGLKPGQSQKPSQGLKPGSSQRPSQSLQGRSQRPSQALKPEGTQRPSQALKPEQSQRPSQGLRPGQSQRPSQALVYGSRGALQTPASPRTRTGPSANPQRVRQPLAPSRQPSAPPQKRRSNRGLIIALVGIVLLLFIASMLFYIVPSATVTVALQAKNLSQQVKLTATDDPQANVQNKVLASDVEQNFSTSGEGAASGTTQVGNATAEGSVSITNNSKINLIIPTGTILQTQSGIQFATDAEAVAPAQDVLPFVPIVAQQAGQSGNVGAGTITVIPQASLNSIVKRNNLKATDISNTNLIVTNDKPTTKGGATSQPAVTAKDLQALTQTLHLKLQQSIKTWLKQQSHNGDLLGKLVPDITASDTPLPEEKLEGAPAVNQPVPNGKFSGNLSLHVKVLIARSKDLQAAAGTQLNEAAAKLRPVYTLASQLPITFTNIKSTPSKDGTSLAITATANGQIIAQLDLAALSNSLTSKGIDQAKEALRTGPMAQLNVRNVDIQVSPGFLSFLPLRASQIQIILRPIAVAPPKNVSNS
ncbi:MAG TPA: baseplate J/gp47 family protein, partial [Ktedonobacteraceae bacterium]|nr:baseplate J/gp47 family protein [Ktedonobacteraceae bacterium]